MLVSLVSLLVMLSGISRARVVTIPQVKGFTSGLNIWLRANFIKPDICERGSAILARHGGTEAPNVFQRTVEATV